MPRGGARPGSGRKPKRQKYATAINRAEKRIADRLPEVVDALLELAAGVRVVDDQVDDQDGDKKPAVYTRPPDRDACKYLVDRILGRPTERHEHAGEDGGPIKLDVKQMTDEELRAIVDGEAPGTS